MVGDGGIMKKILSLLLISILWASSTASIATAEMQHYSSDSSQQEAAPLDQEFTGGAISSNSKMLRKSEPYIISAPIDIPEGVSLSVEPGVQIVSTAGVLFRVQGSLDIQGDESNPVRVQLSGAFVSAVETRSGSDPESLKIEFAEIQGGTSWQLDYPSFSQLHIRHTDIVNQECGSRTNNLAIRSAKSTFSSNFISGTCGFNFNINFGVFGPRGTFSVNNNHFFGDPKSGAWLSASALRGDTLTLRLNTFTELKKKAIVSGFFKTTVYADDNYWPELSLYQARTLAEGTEDTVFAPASVVLKTMLALPAEDTPANRRFEEKLPPPIEVKPVYTVNQKTLATFQGEVTTLTNQQKAQVKAAVDANPNAEKFICTGIRYYDQPMAVNIMVRKRAKAACEYAKQLNPSLSTWFQNKPTQARSYAGKVLLTIKSPQD